MRRRLTAAAAIAAATVTAAGCGSGGGKGGRLAVLGDSIAAGRYATAENEAFPQLVAKATDAELDLRGVPGATAKSLQAYGMPKGDVLVVEAGTNDFLRQTARAEFRAAYRGLLAKARAASPDAKLVCLTVWIPEDAKGVPPPSIPTVYYNDTIARECKDGTTVNISKLFNETSPRTRGPAGRETYSGPGDDFHPNTAGHALIAQLVEQALS